MATQRRRLTLFRRQPPIGDPPVIHPPPHEAEGPRLLASSSCAVFPCAVFQDGNDASTKATVPVLSCDVALTVELRCVEMKTHEASDEELPPPAKMPKVTDGGSSLHKPAGLAVTSLENTPVNHMKSEH